MSPSEIKRCYICPSDRLVEDHHYDCKGGELSPETVPLCKRCHRTYHDLGVEWFEDGYLDKAIQIENKRRQIVYESLKEPAKPFRLVLLRREDIRRSDYFNKTHGIKTAKKSGPLFHTKPKEAMFRGKGIDPLPGWDWYFEHFNDPPPLCEMVIYYDGEKVAEVTGNAKRGTVRRIMRSCGERRVK